MISVVFALLPSSVSVQASYAVLLPTLTVPQPKMYSQKCRASEKMSGEVVFGKKIFIKTYIVHPH